MLRMTCVKPGLNKMAGDGRSSTKVVLPEKEKSSRPPDTVVPILKLYY